MALIFLALVLVLIVLFYKWSVSKYQTFTERGVPFIPPKPLLGNVDLKVMLGRASLLQSMLDQHQQFKDSKIYGIYNMRDPIFMLRDAELIKKVGIKEFDHFSNHRSVLTEESEALLSKSLIALKDRLWKQMRNTLTPTFTGLKMRNMYALVNTCSEQCVQYIEKELESSDRVDVEMKDFFTRFANDVIASAAFGIKVNSFENKENEFYTTGQTITQFTGLGVLKAMLLTLMPSVMKTLRISIFNQERINYFKRLVYDTMTTRKQQNIVRPDMIHLLMEAQRQFREQNPGESELNEFSDDDLLAQCLLFFFAGFETVSTCLCFSTYELCKNPEVQAKLYEEILAVEAQLQGKPLDYDTLMKMEYMDMFISESLRKWPPAIALDRVCNADIDLRDDNNELIVSLKKDDILFMPVFAIHHDPENFPEPEKFKPERFAEQNKHEVKPFTYLPFGVGPRNCIGNRLALMEVKSIIYHLILKFKLVPTDKTVEDLIKSMVGFRLLPKEKYWLKCVPRETV